MLMIIKYVIITLFFFLSEINKNMERLVEVLLQKLINGIMPESLHSNSLHISHT